MSDTILSSIKTSLLTLLLPILIFLPCHAGTDDHTVDKEMRVYAGPDSGDGLAYLAAVQLLYTPDGDESEAALGGDLGFLFENDFSMGVHYRFLAGEGTGSAIGLQARLLFGTRGNRLFVETNISSVHTFNKDYLGVDVGIGCLFPLDKYCGLAVSIGATNQKLKEEGSDSLWLKAGLFFLPCKR